MKQILKCDNCDFELENITISDKHINSLCPKCHSNLMTFDDYLRALDFIFVNSLFDITDNKEMINKLRQEGKSRMKNVHDLIEIIAEKIESDGNKEFYLNTHEGYSF